MKIYEKYRKNSRIPSDIESVVYPHLDLPPEGGRVTYICPWEPLRVSQQRPRFFLRVLNQWEVSMLRGGHKKCAGLPVCDARHGREFPEKGVSTGGMPSQSGQAPCGAGEITP